MKNEVNTVDLTFLGNNPGAVKYGNFINYYSFHNALERKNKLQPDMFPNKITEKVVCLDVGCNTGDLTKELYQYLKSIYVDYEVHMLGVDIDPTLIQRAQDSHDITNIRFLVANIVEKNDEVKKYLASHGKNKFDISFCFSVTMWIHLNNGDQGLLDFLEYIKDISRTIVIEPQPWNCYRVAQRRVKKGGSTFEHYEGLKIRSEVDAVIGNIILEGNFNKVYESPLSSWNRKIVSYHSKN